MYKAGEDPKRGSLRAGDEGCELPEGELGLLFLRALRGFNFSNSLLARLGSRDWSTDVCDKPGELGFESPEVVRDLGRPAVPFLAEESKEDELMPCKWSSEPVSERRKEEGRRRLRRLRVREDVVKGFKGDEGGEILYVDAFLEPGVLGGCEDGRDPLFCSK